MERLPKRLSQRNTVNGIGFDQIEDGSKEPRILEALRRLNILAIKVRTGEIDQQGVEMARRCLRADLIQRRLLVGPPMRAHHYQTARTLLVRHGATEGLRTLDALQLAIALDLRQLGLIAVIVAADQRLCRVALLAGCSALNPERPGPLLV